MRIQNRRTVVGSLAGLMFLPSLGFDESEWTHSLAPVAAVAVLHPASDRPVVGKIHFRSTGDALVIELELGGLVPQQRYRLRIHEYGDCSVDKAANTGEPFGSSEDLIEFLADENGWADIVFTHRGHTLGAGEQFLLGRSVVVHGAREPVGCGTIGFAKRSEALPHNPEDPG